MIAILADDGRHPVGASLRDILQSRGAETEYIPLEAVSVKPCYGCNKCASRESFGKCVVRDDSDWILPNIIAADTVIVVSPVTFGSYSFKVKRVLDKLGLIMDRHYHVKNRQIVKGNLTGRFHLVAIGVTEDGSPVETAAFRTAGK